MSRRWKGFSSSGMSVTKAAELLQTQNRIIKSFPEVASVYGKAGRAATATAGPLDGKVREQAWTGTVHGLFAELGVGASTASSLELALALTGMLAAFGMALIIAGGGLDWAAWPARVKAAQASGLKDAAPA